MAAPFWYGRAAAWLMALAAAGVLGVVGFSLGREMGGAEGARLTQEQAALAEQLGRCNAVNQSLKTRVAALQRELAECRQSPAVPPETVLKEKPGSSRRKLIRRGQAALFLDGKLVVSLEEVGGSPRRARIRVRVRGGRDGEAVMRPGSEVSFKVEGRLYRLLVKELHAASAAVILTGP